MSRRGRFGKYGETKRIERLRRSRIPQDSAHKKEGGSYKGGSARKKKVPQDRQIRTRAAELCDLKYIRSLSRRAFSRFGPYEEILARWFSSGMIVTIMALKRKKPAGFVMMGLPESRPYPPGVTELIAVAVERRARRLGIGDLLMRKAEKTAGEIGITHLVLFTALDNSAARSLFAKSHFIPIGIMRGFYPGGQDAIMMEKVIL